STSAGRIRRKSHSRRLIPAEPRASYCGVARYRSVQAHSLEQGSSAMLRKLLIAAAALAATTNPSLAQDVEAGETAFKKCSVCHDAAPTAKNKVGPVLNGLDGRHSGTIPGYNYSDANKNSSITWDEAAFLDYIKDPKAKIPNTKMVFPGIKNEN